MFTINGSTCHLTRINSTIVVPPRERTSTKVIKKTQPSSNNSGKLEDITNIGSSSKYKSVASKISNNSEPNNNWGPNVSIAPSSSRVHFRRTRLIMETIHVEFDELTTMAFEQFSLGSGLQLMTPGTISSGLVQNP
ncbi:hypothetical protein Tco_1408738 [Tanacetum coccineum]